MRVIAGSARRLLLKTPEGMDTRPTTDRIKEMLTENVYSTVTLSDISSVLFFSKTYIKTIFKKNTGMTVMQYFTALKTDEAKKLISCDKYTFTEIFETIFKSFIRGIATPEGVRYTDEFFARYENK